MRTYLLTLFVLLFSNFLFSQPFYTVNGYVKDIDTKEPIIGAAVFQLNTVTNGTPTDENGYFSLDFKKKEIYIKLAYIGYKDTVLNLYVNNDTLITVFLKNNTEIEEVKIEDDEIRWHPVDFEIKGLAKPISAFAVNQHIPIDTVPIIIPPKKYIKSSTNLIDYFLRQGNAYQQELYYIDGIRIYTRKQTDVSRFFNSSSVGKLNYIYGNFPSKYEGYVSPIIDFSLKEGNLESYEGLAEISLFDVSAFAEGPVLKNKSSLSFAVHRTFINNPFTDLFKTQNENTFWAEPLAFNFITSYFHKLTEKDFVKLSVLNYTDKAKYEQNVISVEINQPEFKQKYSERISNTVLDLNYKHLFSSDFSGEASFFLSTHKLSNLFEGDSIGLIDGVRSRIIDYYASYSNKNNDIGMNLTANYKPNSEHNLEFGTKLINHHFRLINAKLTLFDSDDLENKVNIDTVWQADAINTQEYILYAQDSYKFSEQLKIEGGLHFSSFITNGKSFFSIEPRLYAEYSLSDKLSVNLSFVNFKQYLHLISNRSIGLSTDIYMPSGESLLPQISNFATFGVKSILAYSIDFTADFYVKYSNHVTEYKQNFGFYNYDNEIVFAGLNMYNRLEQGKENAVGLRLLFKKDFNKIKIQIADYVSFVKRKFEELNFSEPFNYRHNQVQNFNFRIQYKITEQLNAGFEWIYKSGNFVTLQKQNYLPYNYQTGLISTDFQNTTVYNINGDLTEISDDVNLYKLPAYHRADVFLTYQTGHHLISFKMYNIYNRKNPDFIDFEKGVFTHAANNQMVSYTVFPFFPVLTYSYKFE
jgi:hypothetical protein